MKYCSKQTCTQENPQPLSNFAKDRATKDGKRSNCKACGSLMSKLWSKNNPELKRIAERNWRLKNPKKQKGSSLKKYWPGLTGPEAWEEFEKLSKSQNGLCRICSKDNGVRLLCVDHDHKTGKVRGLLCTKHNKAIGLLSDNIEFVNNVLSYLRKSSG